MKTNEIIKEIMLSNELSQEKLAKILNVSQKAVSNWLNEIDTPNSSSIMLIYEKFGITPNELLGVEEPQQFKIITNKKAITNNSFKNNVSNTEYNSHKIEVYSKDEKALIETYRELSAGKRNALFEMLEVDTITQKRRKQNDYN